MMWMPRAKPPFLYKYCSAPRAAQIVNDLTFYFSSSSSLNDLYEFRPRSLYKEDGESKFRVFAKRLIAEGWYDNSVDALDAAKSMTIEAVEDTYEQFIDQVNRVCKAAMMHSGVTCFSSERNNQRMWGTYGSNHSGAVLEFATDTDKSRFSAHLMPVIYTDVKLPICPSNLITDRMTTDERWLGLFFCIKHLHWKEENEWRLLLLADTPQDANARTIAFERSALTRVFLGPRIAPKDEDLMRAAADRHVPSIPVIKRRIDEDLAKEQFEGIEEIRSFEQIRYWFIDRRR